MTTAAPHPMGHRRKNHRHAGDEDVFGLMLVMTFLVLILMSLVLLPFFPWGALSTVVCTGVVSVVIGRRMTHHRGDRWRVVSPPTTPEPIEDVQDVVEPTHVWSYAPEDVPETPVVHHRHRLSTSQKWKLAGWGVLIVLWLRNVRDRQELDTDRLLL